MKAFISCVVGIVVLLTFSIEAVALDDDPNLDPRLPIEDESVSEEDVSDLIEEQMDEQLDRLGFTEIEQFWEDIRRDYESFLPESQKGSFTDFLDGDQQFSPTEWGRALLNFLFHELTANVNLLGTLILLAVFSMVLKALQNAFEHAAVSKVAYSVTFTVLIVISMNSFYIAMSYAQEAVANMVHFMIALLPMVLALLAITGATTTAALFHPLIIVLVNTSGLLIERFVLPLLFISAIVSVASSMSEKFQLTRLATLIRNVAMGTLGAFLTIFLAVISVQGATSAISDGVTLRTAKYIAGNFVPVVGRMFTDATDTVIGASLLLKNTVGIAGLFILFVITVFPALKILVLALTFQIVSAIMQPLGGGALGEVMSLFARTVMFMFAAVSVVCLMFFLAITIIISAGNLALMVR
ncbi:stage III sporulation protein AE [Geomicrobium sp. JCM 19037]|uniref:stage III sporulation protein AE n=1 Tax=unclassified Geomicrobium TaxID=2628951 RepID=UPI00045F3993|nr:MULTISPECIES: stage III sporulation protein AE [unclassified Geomicrobium]GAK03335.1 stage III sporulation protein AE [Geomicrobium sp. JCM 19037]GAK12796.1 stage III sporulation protein AE [Geomicrobium sp. JCM 19039]